MPPPPLATTPTLTPCPDPNPNPNLLEVVAPGDAIVASTGYNSRELYALREARGEAHDADCNGACSPM